MLDVSSTDKGFLMPRMTTAEIAAIASPANGLMVYCTTNGNFYIYNSIIVAWKEIKYGSGVIPTNCGVNNDTRDGNINNTVVIGTQCWMAKNLTYLLSVVGPGTGSETTSYYYVYGYDGTDVTAAKATANYQTYGVLYNWLSSLTACPTGWHLPTDAEWSTLTAYLGGESVAGGKLKETGTIHWTTPNTGADNSSGFTSLPAGYRNGSGSFDVVSQYGYWWSSAEMTTGNAWDRFISYGDVNVTRSGNSESYGFTVRCLRN